MRRSITVMALAAALLVASASVALAGGPKDIDKFDKEGWICGEDFVPNHCLNVNSKGKTLNIKVFPPDARGPQESGTEDPKADSRRCPHDKGGSGPFGTDPDGGDGTWWNYFYDDIPGDGVDPVGPLYVCHHSGQQSK